ncbi:MAG: hypothetical protein ACLR07_10330 [Christensenellales bacterium]
MKRWMVLLTLALCLAGGTTAADKARNIASDADSQYHAAHLENHLDTTDVYCTGNYVKVRNKINGKRLSAIWSRQINFSCSTFKRAGSKSR